jgi:hypothetical protein
VVGEQDGVCLGEIPDVILGPDGPLSDRGETAEARVIRLPY